MPEIERRVREYQRPLHSYMIGGGTRAIEIAHRRWGKDEIALAVTCELAHKRVGSYWHCLPEYEQARKALWTQVNAATGRRRIDEAFPPEIRITKDEQQMFIRLKNGSTWQLIGSDRYDSTVGAGPAGIVYSEWALANPSAWSYHRPMLIENGGWAMFITTPRGHNHAKSLYDFALTRPDEWFAEVSSVLDTEALTPKQLDDALGEYQALHGIDAGRARFEQEYLCSFDAAILGAYFGAEMAQALREERIRDVPVMEGYPVHTAWDLGKAVNNPIWCFQVVDNRPRIVDFYRPESDDLEQWCKWLDDRGYKGIDYVPHDILTTEWGNKRTRYETLRLLGRKPYRIPMVSVADGLQAARKTINAAVFDAVRCEFGIEGLRNYRREWDDELKTFRENPVKDWAEHVGSAFRYLGLAWQEVRADPAPKPLPKFEYHGMPDGTIQGPRIIDIINARKRKRENAL
jgi:phage terminase large subunit